MKRNDELEHFQMVKQANNKPAELVTSASQHRSLSSATLHPDTRSESFKGTQCGGRLCIYAPLRQPLCRNANVYGNDSQNKLFCVTIKRVNLSSRISAWVISDSYLYSGRRSFRSLSSVLYLKTIVPLLFIRM
jgi:hypothetical protein